MRKRPRIFIISGPSGSGKTTLYKKLLKQASLRRCLVKAVSVTTRSRRHNEKAGRDYEFVSRSEFLKRRRNKDLLESQNVFGYLYGTSKKNVEAILKSGKHCLLVVDVNGERAIKKIFPNSISIFIFPPTLAVLKNRLKNRSTESKKDLQRRLLVARQEIRWAKRFDYAIVNDCLRMALKKLRGIILSNY